MDRNKAANFLYSGDVIAGELNADGYPQIMVRYKWKMCNDMATDFIQLDPKRIKTLVNGVEMGRFERKNGGPGKGGVIGPNRCRSTVVNSRADTSKPKTKIYGEMFGYLKSGTSGKIYNGNPRIVCMSNKQFNYKVKYSDSCQLSVSSTWRK